MATEQTSLYRRVDEILWKDWDPICRNNSAPRDEYQSYTPAVYNLKVKNGSREAIAQHLYKMEVEKMGLTGNIIECRKVADKILEA